MFLFLVDVNVAFLHDTITRLLQSSHTAEHILVNKKTRIYMRVTQTLSQ